MRRSLLEIISSLSVMLDKRVLKKLKYISEAMMTIQGRITMLSISRWNGKYSYRSIERFFDEKLNWLEIKWAIVKKLLSEEVILAGDETVVTKSGIATNGVDYFYSSTANKAVKGLSFLAFSVISVKDKKSYPIYTHQIKKSKFKSKNKSEKSLKRAVGRPKGSKNKNREDIRLTGLFRMVNICLGIILKVVKLPKLRYFVYDGAFGNNMGVQAVIRHKLELISKLKKNSALYLEFDGKQKDKGANKKYGDKIDYENIDKKYLIKTKIDGNKQINIYQFKAFHKTINRLLNIVVVFALDTKSGKKDYKVLFSTDINLSAEKIVEYYSLRFQIEFNFRDAKQFFGLEDFMNIKKRRIHNFANLSLFMNNIAYSISKDNNIENNSINDLKSLFLAQKYIHEVLKLSPKNIDDNFIANAISQVADFSLINKKVA
jgi:putative transposase